MQSLCLWIMNVHIIYCCSRRRKEGWWRTEGREGEVWYEYDLICLNLLKNWYFILTTFIMIMMLDDDIDDDDGVILMMVDSIVYGWWWWWLSKH